MKEEGGRLFNESRAINCVGNCKKLGMLLENAPLLSNNLPEVAWASGGGVRSYDAAERQAALSILERSGKIPPEKWGSLDQTLLHLLRTAQDFPERALAAFVLAAQGRDYSFPCKQEFEQVLQETIRNMNGLMKTVAQLYLFRDVPAVSNP